MGKNIDIASKIVDCLSDGYDDEEYRDQAEEALRNELSQVSSESIIRTVFLELCERVEDLESM